MKHFTIILLLSILGTTLALGQKSKIKGDSATVKTDSVSIGKAAIRGAQLMQASRDSLKGADLQPPSDIVDTFGIQVAHPGRKTYLYRADIQAADKRLANAKAVLEEAEFDLEFAKTDPKFTPNEVQDAETKLKLLQEYLDGLESKLTALKYDWEETTGARLDTELEEPKTLAPTVPAVPKAPAKPGAKDAIKGGKGK
jgi:hypothetical protein